MPDNIESVKPILTVIDDEGDLILSSTGVRGKRMLQVLLAQAAEARKVTTLIDGDMKVMKRNGNGSAQSTQAKIAELAAQIPALARAASAEFAAALAGPGLPTSAPRAPVDLAATLAAPDDGGGDIQDQFAADLAAGRTGEAAMGEQAAPTPGPSDPVAIPHKRPPRQIFQDAAAPPAPELAEAEMARLVAEAAQAEQDAARVKEDQRFQSQQAVQANIEPTTPVDETPKPRARRERQLATTGRPCGRCGGGGQIQGEAGFQGACPVCHGEGQVKTWDRSLKVR